MDALSPIVHPLDKCSPRRRGHTRPAQGIEAQHHIYHIPIDKILAMFL